MERKNGNFDWNYAPAPESRSILRLRDEYGLFIGGRFSAPRSGRYFQNIEPANGNPLGKVAWAGPADVQRAVRSARQAYDQTWSRISPTEKGKYIFRIARLIQERARELAVLESVDSGKPIRESRDFDIPNAAAHFFYYAGWADKLEYAFPNRKPAALGVAAQIIPWNFPLLMAAWKMAPALACGNTVVLKPAETTPLSALLLAEIIRDSGLPPGVVNIVTGDGDTGKNLLQTRVDKVAFTGSTAVGKEIQASVDPGIRLSLELGGKSANIILEDAPIDQAIEGIVNAIFFNQGQVCCAGSRLLVQENVAAVVLKKLSDRIRKLRLGDPLDKNTDIGAINNPHQLRKIAACVESAVQCGLEVIRQEQPLPEKGLFYPPTLILNPGQNDPIVQEEIFGPVLCIQTFRTIEEAIEKANNIPYGLSAGVWTEKGSRALSMASALKAGVIWCNTFNRFDPGSPFGGFKESGFGREGGLQGLLPYLRLR